jgi:hypothetical protein
LFSETIPDADTRRANPPRAVETATRRGLERSRGHEMTNFPTNGEFHLYNGMQLPSIAPSRGAVPEHFGLDE